MLVIDSVDSAVLVYQSSQWQLQVKLVKFVDYVHSISISNTLLLIWLEWKMAEGHDASTFKKDTVHYVS